jgi:hypothetical protein
MKFQQNVVDFLVEMEMNLTTAHGLINVKLSFFKIEKNPELGYYV